MSNGAKKSTMSASYDSEIQLRDTDHEETAVLSDLFEALESADDIPTFGEGPSGSAFIAKPEMELHTLMPEGPYTLRILGKVYDEVYDDLLMELLKRGLLTGAEVWRAPAWIPFSDHPDFGAIQSHLSDELERIVQRKRPREHTPQPHWKVPEDVRKTDEVTRPHVPRDEIFGLEQSSDGLEQSSDAGHAEDSEALEDCRKTAEFTFDASELLDADDGPTRQISGEVVDDLALEVEEFLDNPFADQIPTDISQPLDLVEASEESIETREVDSPLLATEIPTRERPKQERPRKASPLEGSRSAATAFPTAANPKSGPERGVVPAPPSAILKPSRRRVATADVRAIQSVEVKEPSRVPTWVVYLAALAIVLSLISIAVLALRHWTRDADATPTSVVQPSPAIQAAQLRVNGALPQPFTDARDVAAVAASLGDVSPSEKLWVLESLHAAQPNAETAIRLAEARLASGDFDEARNGAVEGLMLGADEDDAAEVFSAAVRRDESLRAMRAELMTADQLKSLKSGSDHLLMQLTDGRRGVLIPSTQNDPNAHDPAIALASLCDVLDCSFEVAETSRVWVTKALLESSLAETPREGELAIDEMLWATSEHGEIVEGAIVIFPSGSTPFPITDLDVWRPWLAGTRASEQDAADFAGMLKTARVPVSKRHDIRRDLSSMLTVDFLVNNWSRIPADEHTTTVFDGGNLVSIRHSAAFATRSSKRVSGRFGWVEVFDRDLIARIRLLRPEALDPIVFAGDDPVTAARAEEFWKQREQLIEVVEDTELQRGEEVWLTE